MTPTQRTISLAFIFTTPLLVLSSCVFNVVQQRRTDMIMERVILTKIDEDVTFVTVDQVPDVVVVLDKRLTSDPVRIIKVRPQIVEPKEHISTWTLPYSCEDVKYYASLHLTKAQQEAARIAAHVAEPTADQMRQINECLGK